MTSHLNKKCTLTYKGETDIHWPSAKCVEENNGFVKLVPFDKAKGEYDEINFVWIDLTDKRVLISWR